MQKVSTRLSAICGTVALLTIACAPLLAITPNVYAAHGADASTTTTNSSSNENDTETTEPTSTNNTAAETSENQTTEHEAEGKAQTTEVKLKVCQNHQQVVDNIMARITDRGQRRLDLFTTIAKRVETFYVTKGKTLSNYNTLVADVNNKQAAAQVAVTSVKTIGGSFSCTTSPSNGVSSFRTALRAELAALDAYQKSIRNLIVAVKSVTGTTTSASNQSTSGGNQ